MTPVALIPYIKPGERATNYVTPVHSKRELKGAVPGFVFQVNFISPGSARPQKPVSSLSCEMCASIERYNDEDVIKRERAPLCVSSYIRYFLD